MTKRRIDSLFSLLAVTIAASGCQEYETIRAEMQNPHAGGEGTVFASTADAYSLPMKNITARHRVDFVVGNALFKENWVPSPSSVESRQGLGPLKPGDYEFFGELNLPPPKGVLTAVK